MPEVDGMAVLREARAATPAAEVVILTAHGSTESAVAAMRAGAADYLTKPFSMDELRMRVRRLAEQRASEARTSRLVEQLTPGLVAVSARMQKAIAAARQVAATEATVLIVGESGTGKSQLARLVHFASSRATGPFAEVHCAALTETLLESELFGHEKGAFTGAHERKAGHLSAAQGGTLFLDEVGEITPTMQVKLLRFLQDREFVPVGGTQARKVDARVVAATNRDLAAAVRAGSFREDFFYRLNVFAIEVPPLRDRPEDVLPLAEHYLARRGLPSAKLSPAARRRMLEHAWPGNVRELENSLERALILAGEGQLEAEHVAPVFAARSAAARAADMLGPTFDLDAFERELVYTALERAGGNKSAAARLLGISRRRLYSRLEEMEG
jgi:DNA-binding NtrC family response regulator